MLIGIVEGANAVLQPPPGMANCEPLQVRRAFTEGDGLPVMISAWIPTEAELLRLRNGAPVQLWIYGSQHPPVSVEVGDVPVARAEGDEIAGNDVTIADPALLTAGND